MSKKIPLNVELVDAVLAYLGDQPYVKVAGLIGAIRSEAQAAQQDQVAHPPTKTPKEANDPTDHQ